MRSLKSAVDIQPGLYSNLFPCILIALFGLRVCACL